MNKVKLISTEKASEEAFTYRATETSDNGKLSYGIELEHTENGVPVRVTLPNVTADKSEILKMVHAFAEGCVYPNVFEETAWDYIKANILDRVFAAK